METRTLDERIDAPELAPLPDVGDDLTWRRLERSDLPALVALDRACGAVDHPRILEPADAWDEAFDQTDFHPEVDSVIAFDSTGRAIAYGEARIGAEAATAVKVRLNGFVHPDRRGAGIGTALLSWQEARGKQLLAATGSMLPGWLNAGVESSAVSQRELLARSGYRSARWWLTMDRDLAEPIATVTLADDLRIEEYSAERSEEARLVINDAFRDHWGSQPLDQEEWQSFEHLDIFRSELSAVVVGTAANGTESVAGVLWSMINEDEWEPNGFSFGYIEVVGVAREWRGRRIAQALLSHALSLYKERGLERAMLDVDSESPTGATGIYAKVGFREYDHSETFVKEF